MMHLTEEELILMYYVEPGAPAEAHLHLEQCPECRAAAEVLRSSLSLCDQWKVPERGAEFGRDVWNRLVPEIAAAPVRKHGVSWMPTWVFAGAFALLLVGVFFAGRYTSRSTPAPVMAGLSDRARERILAIAVADHLDRVQILLTEMENDGGNGPVTVASERERAKDLVQEGRLMRQTLAARGETTTTGFLDEVERYLIEAAHTPDNASIQQTRELRDRMESGSLLFKVRIVESNLRNKEQKL